VPSAGWLRIFGECRDVADRARSVLIRIRWVCGGWSPPGCQMARSLAGAAAGPGGGQAGHRPFLDEGGLVLGHQREDAEDELAVGGGGVNDAVGQRLDADAAGFQAGDDLDEVGEVVDSTLGSDLRQAAAALEYLPGDPADSWPASIPDAANAMAAVARSQTRGRRPAERRKIVEAFGEMFRPAAKGRLSG
jgi:hypothetical protein